jgi:hypothetical protein
MSRPASVLALHGTTEGQTRKIARVLAARGRAATLVDAAETTAGLDPAAFDAALIAASLHLERYQAAVEYFVRWRLPLHRPTSDRPGVDHAVFARGRELSLSAAVRSAPLVENCCSP